MYRSKEEYAFAKDLESRGVPFEYETVVLPYVRQSVYRPDFILPGNILVEYKGRLTQNDRAKLLLVKNQHPHADIRLVFSRPTNKIRKGSKTTYAQWAEKNGFPWAFKRIPNTWLV